MNRIIMMRSMQNNIDYMTVNLDLTEVKSESSKGTGVMDEIKERFEMLQTE